MNVLCRRINLTLKICRLINQEARIKCIQSCSFYTLSKTTQVQNLNHTNYSYSVQRYKSKKQQRDPDSDDETENFDDDDLSLSRDSKLLKFNTTSLRTDMILKSALGIARNKVEQLFYESKIRVNGKKIMKKSSPVRIDDEIDIIKSVSPKNADHIYVSRVVVLNLAAKEENIIIAVRRFRNLLIENYEEDPYKSSSSEES